MRHLFRIEFQYDDLRVIVMSCVPRVRYIIMHICILRSRRQGMHLVEARQEDVRKRTPRTQLAIEESL